MIQRRLEHFLKKAAAQNPVVTVTGPRQSGKTTLVKYVFPDYQYISLENLDHRAYALEDPRGFLKQFEVGVILDEVQRTPDLFSYIQTIADEQKSGRRFILTGSQNFLLSEKISQTLAGRSAIINLMPFAKGELLNEKAYKPDDFPRILNKVTSGQNLWQMLFTGFYPPIHDRKLNPQEWLADYYQTYIERDVRSILNVGDLETFSKFIRLCAGRVGQQINYSSLAADCGVSNMTVKRWLSILQSSFIIMPIRPYYNNFNKRMIKSPKLYFLDSGLLIYLLGIRKWEDIPYHAQKGTIFESFVFSELYKLFLNNRLIPGLYFWHDVKRHEVDFIIDRGNHILPIEVKSGETILAHHLKGLEYFQKISTAILDESVLIYAGDENSLRKNARVMSWLHL